MFLPQIEFLTHVYLDRGVTWQCRSHVSRPVDLTSDPDFPRCGASVPYCGCPSGLHSSGTEICPLHIAAIPNKVTKFLDTTEATLLRPKKQTFRVQTLRES